MEDLRPQISKLLLSQAEMPMVIKLVFQDMKQKSEILLQALTTTHLETLAGSTNDWLFWDNYDYNTGAAVTNTAICWNVMGAIFNNWLTLP